MSPGASKSVVRARLSSRRHLSFVAGAAVLAILLGGPLHAGDSSSSKRAAGDGRGLATFGDRGLTTFGDRGLTSFGDRGLTTFSDIPLTPMGGLIPGGVSVSDKSSAGSDRSHSCRHHSGSSDAFFIPPPTRESEVSFGSVSIDDGVADDGSTLLMPRVELPVVVLDHRPALALLTATLDTEIRRADAAGDSDLVRSLDPGRR